MWPRRIALEFARRMVPLVVQADSAKGLVETARIMRVLHIVKFASGSCHAKLDPDYGHPYRLKGTYPHSPLVNFQLCI